MINLNQDEFHKYITRIKGSTFLKSEELKDSVALIAYVENFTEFVSINANSTLSEKDYLDYWSNGDAINKTLMGEPVRILREFPEITSVKMTLPFKGRTYQVVANRDDIQNYFDIDLNKMHEDKENEVWRNEFVDKYLYNKDERNRFVLDFIKEV